MAHDATNQKSANDGHRTISDPVAHLEPETPSVVLFEGGQMERQQASLHVKEGINVVTTLNGLSHHSALKPD